MLSPEDVIEGARVGGIPNLYVLGCFDTRITFYAQQVRALELAHALQHQHLLRDRARVAVIGGGAGGLTAAAALALQDGVTVALYEQATELIPRQAGSTRRRLDPHLYEWPRAEAEHELAELPILDWRSGSAIDVRDQVLRELHDLQGACGDRFHVHLGHTVTNIESVAEHFRLILERDAAAGGRETIASEADVVILAIGFGLEPRRAVHHTDTPGYWEDGGVPGPDITGHARPAFLISGNGDGGLIDLLAAASRDFDHNALVRRIARRPGNQAWREPLLQIDAEARAAEAAGEGYDFFNAYERVLGPAILQSGIVNEMRQELRPGVQLVLQTNGPQPLTIASSRLNRFAVWLVKKACDGDGPERFEHVVCDEIAVMPPVPGTCPLTVRVTCGAREIDTHQLIVRRGPNRNVVREPFAGMLAGFAAEHQAWVERFPEDAIAPELNEETQAHFARLSRDADLAPPRYRQADVAGALPRRIKLARQDAAARWSGDVSIDAAGSAWDVDTAPFEILVPEGPDVLGLPLAHALARLATHADRTILKLDVARWRNLLERLSSRSIDAGGLSAPELRALAGDASIQNAFSAAPDALAARLNAVMDAWLLSRMSAHLERYLRTGEDPARLVALEVADDLRAAMREVWDQWRMAFARDGNLLARFLNLIVCAADQADASPRASVLAGPKLLQPILRCTAAALAIAAVWDGTEPRGAEPGNLTRANGGSERTAHACAAKYIEGQDMVDAMLSHPWTTELVLLPMESTSIVLEAGSRSSLARTEGATSFLGDSGAEGRLMFTVDRAFKEAARGGRAQLEALVTELERKHFLRLRGDIAEESEP